MARNRSVTMRARADGSLGAEARMARSLSWTNLSHTSSGKDDRSGDGCSGDDRAGDGSGADPGLGRGGESGSSDGCSATVSRVPSRVGADVGG
ncbi:hypothetical protein GCM10017779_03220 [Streptomyces capillispiralis]|nr:hypothetical protein GCM10017779_03220 [Streptomyces capillispiralis]